MQKVTLTRPLHADLAAVRNANREARTLTDPELTALLELEERVIRSDFGVYGTDADTNEALGPAMLAGFSSFRKQMAQTTHETVGSDTYSYNVGVVEWPRMVGLILGPVIDYDAAAELQGPSVTSLVRPGDPHREL